MFTYRVVDKGLEVLTRKAPRAHSRSLFAELSQSNSNSVIMHPRRKRVMSLCDATEGLSSGFTALLLIVT